MRDDAERLRDVLNAVDQILAKTDAGRKTFDSDELLQVWVLHHLQIIGEAARCLSQEFRQRHPEGVWSKAAGMRHILVHHYFEINKDQVWKVVDMELPGLRTLVMRILEDETAVTGTETGENV